MSTDRTEEFCNKHYPSSMVSPGSPFEESERQAGRGESTCRENGRPSSQGETVIESILEELFDQHDKGRFVGR